ncbi:HPP family protein [Leptospira gomenensis]|uniref:HPP family protein n=1 Tax=Leptospira gomenensis TaxID=2484974 RepID=A0A5F1Z2R2_9LEPT|nr:HPP family protein [Leptospira gomenensis]TGK35477.1 HPP family protein [Leptospira gomenensis]TGK40631.1 HPP family protein [Leptospira gomenensis]TGK46309.1 HPP family protein [Leptospira gomenensis]TGK66444.1 HPP family protein [Leptospira gomenensis]
MKRILKKMKTEAVSPPRPAYRQILWSWIGGTLGISLIALLSKTFDSPLIMAPFGASCVLLFGVPESPLSQPRNLIGGHLIASTIGLLFLNSFGNDWYILGLAVATSIAIMQLTKTTHPPAGADPIVILMGNETWSFVLTPALSGSLILLILALVFNNLNKDRQYPKFWR